jgi:plastocyanin
VSDGDGVARARYWAPFRTDQENDTTVIITGRPAGVNFNTAVFRTASIFLRAANRPSFPGSNICGFIWEPEKLTYDVGEAISFTATQLIGDDSIAGCAGNEIARYEWIFDDGTTRAGRDVVHAFSTAGEHTIILVTHEAVTGCRAVCQDDLDIVN